MSLPPEPFRRALRRTPTPAEHRLWRVLRAKRLAGLKVRRQHPVGPYVLDFYCHAARLGIEVDGSVHEGPARAQYDAAREQAIRRAGIRLLRFTNDEVMAQIDVVAAAILAAAQSPLPVPEGEGTSPGRLASGVGEPPRPKNRRGSGR